MPLHQSLEIVLGRRSIVETWKRQTSQEDCHWTGWSCMCVCQYVPVYAVCARRSCWTSYTARRRCWTWFGRWPRTADPSFSRPCSVLFSSTSSPSSASYSSAMTSWSRSMLWIPSASTKVCNVLFLCCTMLTHSFVHVYVSVCETELAVYLSSSRPLLPLFLSLPSIFLVSSPFHPYLCPLSLLLSP